MKEIASVQFLFNDICCVWMIQLFFFQLKCFKWSFFCETLVGVSFVASINRCLTEVQNIESIKKRMRN